MLTDSSSVIAYAFGLILVFVFCRIFIKPIKWLFKILLNAVVGGIILAIINFMGGFLGLHIVINTFTAFIAGVLGVPGVFLIILAQYLL